MNTPAPGLHMPLTITYDGTPVLLETYDYLRTLKRLARYMDRHLRQSREAAITSPTTQQTAPTPAPTSAIQEATDAPCELLTDAQEKPLRKDDGAEAAGVENSDVAESVPKRTT